MHDAWVQQIAGQYLLDNVLAAEGIAKSKKKMERPASTRAHTHPPWVHEVLPAGLRCGVRAAQGPG
jgi:hypothetical protein